MVVRSSVKTIYSIHQHLPPVTALESKDSKLFNDYLAWSAVSIISIGLIMALGLTILLIYSKVALKRNRRKSRSKQTEITVTHHHEIA